MPEVAREFILCIQFKSEKNWCAFKFIVYSLNSEDERIGEIFVWIIRKISLSKSTE